MPTPAYHCFLDDHGVLAVTGADAGVFLQGQVSTDMQALPELGAQLTSLNDARGRTLCVCRILRLPDAYLLVLPAAQLDAVAAHLARFVLRARVQLENRSPSLRVAGIAQTQSEADSASLQDAAGSVALRDGIILTKLPQAPEEEMFRALVLVPAPHGDAFSAGLGTGIPLVEPERWRRADIRAGVPMLAPEASGKFLAQWLNLDLLDAVSFSKGCFSGQEVLARTKYRGRIARRMLRLAGDTPSLPAGSVLTRDGATAGEVVCSVPGELLAVLRLGERKGDLRSSDGAALQECDLPYAIPELATD